MIRAAIIEVLAALLLVIGCTSAATRACVNEQRVVRLLYDWKSVQPPTVNSYSASTSPHTATAIQASEGGNLTEVRVSERPDATACECCLMFWFRGEGSARQLETVIMTFHAADADGAMIGAKRLWDLIRGTRGRPLAINVAGLRQRSARYHDLIALEANGGTPFLGDIVILHEEDGGYAVRIAVSRNER